MDLERLERRMIFLSKYSAAAAVVGSLAGGFLMFVLGLMSIYDAYVTWFPWSTLPEHGMTRSAFAIISVIEGLDRFLIAIVLLYFGYGVYSLFIHARATEKDLGLPPQLRVDQIGQLKQVVAEVIIVILFVLFLRTALRAFQRIDTEMTLEQVATLLVLPVCTVLLALALKLAALHPKAVSISRAIAKPDEAEMSEETSADATDTARRGKESRSDPADRS